MCVHGLASRVFDLQILELAIRFRVRILIWRSRTWPLTAWVLDSRFTDLEFDLFFLGVYSGVLGPGAQHSGSPEFSIYGFRIWLSALF